MTKEEIAYDMRMRFEAAREKGLTFEEYLVRCAGVLAEMAAEILSEKAQ